MTYAPPGVSYTSTGATTPVTTGPAPIRIAVLATFPKGPDYPIDTPSTSMVSLYGDPSAQASAQFTGPDLVNFAMQQLAPGGAPFTFLPLRTGVVRGTYAVKDGGSATNQVDTVTITGAPTGGTFTLSYGGQTTSAIAYNATAATVQSALQALSSIGSGNATVSGSAGGPYTVTFAGALGNQLLANLTTNGSGLTGGTTPAVASVITTPGAPGVCFTLSAIGVYAGSAAANLQVSIAVPGGKVTNITFTDAVTLQTVGTPLADLSVGGTYDLSTNAKIVAAINNTNPLTAVTSVARATIGLSSAAPAVITSQAFSAGTDGAGAPYNDASIGTNGSGGLLDQSLYLPVDYIIAGYDAALIGPTLLAHMNAAVAQNDPRKAFLGPVGGTTYASLSSGTYLGGSLQNSRLRVVGHDTIVATNPRTGADTNFDGWHAAAVAAGLKASAPTEETTIGFPVNGVKAVGTPSDLVSAPQATQLTALGKVGLITLTQAYNAPTPSVNDALTTAPQTLNGSQSVNLGAYLPTQDVDDAVARATTKVLQAFKGRPNNQSTIGLIQQEIGNAVSSLGTATNGLNSAVVTQDPNTLAYNATVSYKMPTGIRTINVTSGYTTS